LEDTLPTGLARGQTAAAPEPRQTSVRVPKEAVAVVDKGGVAVVEVRTQLV
jgi:hypothetical protein